MKIKHLLIFLVITFVTSILFTWLFLPEPKTERLDVIVANDIVKTVEENWEKILQGVTLVPKHDIDYVVFDKSGNRVTASNADLRNTLIDVIQNRDTLVDLTVDGEIVGKVLFPNNVSETLIQQQKKLKIFYSIILCVMMGICVIFSLCFIYIVIRPFHKLQEFAERVSAGDLNVPLEMDRGNLFGPFTKSFDMMRTELLKAREKEQKVNQRKKELVASLSHDIKTPVASIKAVAELLLVQEKNEKVSGKLSVIIEKSDQINLLVDNLFHSTLDELQELKVVPTEESSLSISELLGHADYKNRLSHTSLAECLLYIDSIRLAQVFDNLISNSYKYADTKIDVFTSFHKKFLVLSLRDYGPGVADDELRMITKKFYRGRNAGKYIGSGLGLYISHYFIKQMGGALECQNAPDGFIVTIKLPLV